METTYGTGLGPAIAWSLSRVAAVFPFPLSETVIVAFVARQVTGAVGGIVATARGRRGRRNAIACGGLRLGQDVGIAVAFFYLLWGFHYGRPPLEDRLGWPVGEEAEPALVADLAAAMVAAANDAYRELHDTDDSGVPTVLPDPASLDRALEEGWHRAAEAAGLRGAATRWTFGRAKQTLLLGPALDRLGLSGFYFPFTGEANVNRGLPAVSFPQVLAHEKSHQRGLAPEDEANFVGFLSAVMAPDPHARYAAYVFAQRQLLAALGRVDREWAERLEEDRLPGVRRDLEDLADYWRRHRGRARGISRKVNDAFLRTNRVEGGVLSYGRSVDLLVACARTGRLPR